MEPTMVAMNQIKFFKWFRLNIITCACCYLMIKYYSYHFHSGVVKLRFCVFEYRHGTVDRNLTTICWDLTWVKLGRALPIRIRCWMLDMDLGIPTHPPSTNTFTHNPETNQSLRPENPQHISEILVREPQHLNQNESLSDKQIQKSKTKIPKKRQ